MTQPHRPSLRTLFRWFLLGLALWFSFAPGLTSQDIDSEELPTLESTIERGQNGLAADLRPLRVGPGGGFLVDIRDASEAPRPDQIEELTMDGQSLEATTLIDGRRMFRVPENAKLGRRTIHVRLRDRSELTAGLEVRSSNQRKIARNIIGGLALLLYGLRIFSKGLRRVVSRRLQRGVEGLTKKRLGSMSAGLLLGPMVQTGASAVGLVYGFVDSRLIRPIAAFWLLWGALISLSAAAALLPFASFREALLFVGVGVAWLMLSRTRRQRGMAQILLGGGLLFHGVRLTRVGFASLISNPELLSYASFLQTDTVGGWTMCWISGLLLACLFQGPGALVVLVLGLLEALGLIGVPGALAILAGAFAGTPISALALSWPFGAKERRIVGLVSSFALLGSLFLLFAQPLLLVLLDPWIEGDPNLAIWGKKQVLPYAGTHLISTHLAALLLLSILSCGIALIPRWSLPRSKRGSPMDATWAFERWIFPKKNKPGSGALSLRRQLLLALAEIKAALPEAQRMTLEGERTLGSILESRVTTIQDASRELLKSVKSTGHELSEQQVTIPARYLRSTALILFYLEQSLDRLRRVSDAFIERGERMRPHDKDILQRIGALLEESVDEVITSIRDQEEIDLESIQSREIQINAIELEHRRHLYQKDEHLSIRGEVLTAELVSAFENTGNQIYRLVQSLEGMPMEPQHEGLTKPIRV